MDMAIDDLPGAALIRAGLSDLEHRRETIASFLVQIASPKLRRSGIKVDVDDAVALEADHRLYDLLSREYDNEAHSRYNALLRELVSFERALEQRVSR
jgi:hypothetical protein